MRKQIIEYTSTLDALIALAKQLSVYEIQYRMEQKNSSQSTAKEKLQIMKYLLNGRTTTNII
jgi:hypothetical protein